MEYYETRMFDILMEESHIILATGGKDLNSIQNIFFRTIFEQELWPSFLDSLPGESDISSLKNDDVAMEDIYLEYDSPNVIIWPGHDAKNMKKIIEDWYNYRMPSKRKAFFKKYNAVLSEYIMIHTNDYIYICSIHVSEAYYPKLFPVLSEWIPINRLWEFIRKYVDKSRISREMLLSIFIECLRQYPNLFRWIVREEILEPETSFFDPVAELAQFYDQMNDLLFPHMMRYGPYFFEVIFQQIWDYDIEHDPVVLAPFANLLMQYLMKKVPWSVRNYINEILLEKSDFNWHAYTRMGQIKQSTIDYLLSVDHLLHDPIMCQYADLIWRKETPTILRFREVWPQLCQLQNTSDYAILL